MRFADRLQLAAGALGESARRTALMASATAIGVAAVIVLATLGDGARRFVVDQFQGLGANLLVVLPGRSETVGGPPPLFGATPRDLTLGDALSLARRREVLRVAPIMVGQAPVSTARGREREVDVIGTTASLAELRRLGVAQGRFLPGGDPTRAQAVAVLGRDLRRELFGEANALGQWVRVGDRRLRVIGVLAPAGVSIGVDYDDLALVPVATAQALFDRESLFRVLVELDTGVVPGAAADVVRRHVASRHDGEDDVTVITQDSVIATLGRVLDTLTAGVAGISAVSLLVAGILIMNVMLVAVSQRRSEVGLMKALGASAGDIARLFLVEAVLLAALGGACGLALGHATVVAIAALYPAVPFTVPLGASLAALGVALATGVVFGVLPARRAAALDPVAALARR